MISEASVSSLTVIEASFSYSLVTAGAGFDSLTLTAGGISGTANADTNNLITGNDTTGAGADTLISNSAGTDTLIGNYGSDTFTINSTNEVGHITENSSANGGATVESSVSFTLGANMSALDLTSGGSTNLAGTDILNGAGGHTITGDTGNYTLSDNNSTLGDVLTGDSAAGHDTFIVHNALDTVDENGAGTASLVQAYGSFSLASTGGSGGGIHRLTLLGTGTGLTATGNTSGNDTIIDSTSGSGGNIIHTGGGVDALTDNAGNDTFFINNVGDTITENHISTTATVEFDTTNHDITYTLGANITNLTLTGTGTDSVTGNAAGFDVIRASNGIGTNVISDGAGGHDTMYGGSNNGSSDTFMIHNANDSIIGSNTGDTADLIEFFRTSDTITLGININNLTIESTGNGHDTIIGNADNDSISGGTSHSNTFKDGGTDDTHVVLTSGGQDTMYGGGGFDSFVIHNTNDVIHEASVGQYLVESFVSYDLSVNATAAGNANVGNLTLEGSANLSATAAATGNDVLVGNTGNDLLTDSGATGGNNADTMVGNASGTGASDGDTFVVSNSLDTVTENTSTELASLVEASVSYTLGAGIVNLVMEGSGSVAGTGNVTGAHSALIIGNSGNDTLSDGGSYSGLNVVTGASNADTMIGHSAGGDTFMVYTTGDHVTELGAGTTSAIDSYISFSLVNTNVNSLTLLALNADLTGTANNGADTIIGAAALTGHKDTLISGSGIDSLVGNSVDHNDTFTVGNSGDHVSENAIGGAALIKSTVSFDLTANAVHVNSLTLTGSATDTIKGSGAAGTLDASASTGTVVLNDGSVSGGDEIMKGGTGHDTFVISDASDAITINGTAANSTISTNVGSFDLNGATIVSGAANNLILTKTSANYTATANTTGNDVLTGAAAVTGHHDILTGDTLGVHTDTMHGNSVDGDDTFNVYNAGDVVTEVHGASNSAALISSTVSYTLSANVDELILTGAATGKTMTGNGSTTDNITIQDNSSLGGNTLNDGGTGATTNTLTDDSTNGGDTFIVTNTSDVVTETHGAASALVEANTTYSLAGRNIDKLTLTGDANATGTGNADGNVITGNLGDDVLNAGGTANDTLIGNSIDGSDTFNLLAAGDTVSEAVSGGAALITSTHSFDLHNVTGGGSVDSLTLMTNGGLTATANDDANVTLFTTGAGDTLISGTGIDNMSGHGAGDDFQVHNASDVVTESVDGATVDTTVAFTLGAHMSILNLTGTGTGLTLAGNGLAATITDATTGSGHNILDDRGAISTLTDTSTHGGDTFMVSSAGDTVHETNGGSSGLVESTDNFTLVGTGVNNLTITGSGLTATANAAADTLTDASGGNTLTAGAGGDTLVGGNDVMTGGAGADHFAFTVDTAYSGVAVINGYNNAADTLDISGIISAPHSGAISDWIKLVSDGGTGTEVLVDYGGKTENPSYSFVEVAHIVGVDVTAGITNLIF